MDEPIRLDRFIQLLTTDALDKSQIKSWLNCVKNSGPSGVFSCVQTTDDKGTLQTISIIHREYKARNGYLIPLSRNLQENEVQKIVDAFAEENEDLNFDIETNETRVEASEKNSITISNARHIEICDAMSKSRHRTWMQDRLDDGWRYGIAFDSKEKTHPLLRPWEQLPDQFKKPDLDAPQAMLDLIKAQGYVIISKDALDRLK